MIAQAQNFRVEEHLGLARMVALDFVPPGISVMDTDIYQEACVGLMEAVELAPEHYNPRWKWTTWASAVIRNRVIKYLRKEGRLPTQPLNGTDVAIFEDSERIDFSLYVDLVSRILSEDENDNPRTRRYKEILRLRFLEKKTLKQIGRQFRVSKEAIRVGIGRAVKQLGPRFHEEIGKIEQTAC